MRSATWSLILIFGTACGSSHSGSPGPRGSGGAAAETGGNGGPASGGQGLGGDGLGNVGTGGAGSGGRDSSGGGASASGGSASGGTAGAPFGGAAGRAAGATTGQGAGGGGGGGGGSGGGFTGGAGGSNPGRPATPSAGCGKSGRPSGGVVMVANDHLYTFPESYDGKSPMPLLLAFHANGNPNTQIRDLTNGSGLETAFIRAFPKSIAAGWAIDTDGPRVTAVYNDLLANYCVDTGRVFATGHSSGAQMVVQMLCVAGGEKRFKAVAPVAASKYCDKISPIPVMYIQGQKDAGRGNSNGIDVVNVFSSSNACAATTAPTPVASCNSKLDNQPVTPGCVSYQGCAQPTVWCSHNDNSYNLTDGNMHGWPCFASAAMYTFFTSLP